MKQVSILPEGLDAFEAKQRERTIQALTTAEMESPDVIRKLETIANSDPVAYVREAARAALIRRGQGLEGASAPGPRDATRSTRALMMGLGCILIPMAILFLLAFLVVLLYLFLGPHIGTSFASGVG